MNSRLKLIDWFLGGQQVDPGLAYLLANSRAYYDFTDLSGSVGDTVPATYPDLSENERDLTRLNSPTISQVTVDTETYNGLNTVGSNEAYLMPGNGIGLFDSSFEVWLNFRSLDGRNATTQRLIGVLYPTNGTGGTACYLQVIITDNGTAAGKLQISYGTNGTGYIFRSNSFTLPDNDTGQQIMRLRFDFENDTVLLELNGTSSTLTNVSGTGISSIDPANWNASALGFAIGNSNNNGAYFTNPVELTICRFAVTGLLSDLEAAQVFDYFDLGV